jgi:hypothetical protein
MIEDLILDLACVLSAAVGVRVAVNWLRALDILGIIPRCECVRVSIVVREGLRSSHELEKSASCVLIVCRGFPLHCDDVLTGVIVRLYSHHPITLG